MRYVYGAISWILGGLILGGSIHAFAVWFGWVLLAAGVALFLPPLWEMETRQSSRAAAYLLRGPYLAAGSIFGVLGVICAGAMGSVIVDGAVAESIGLAFGSMLMFASGSALALPVLRNVRRLELEGRPQPLAFNVFEVAQASGGRVTPAELAAMFGVEYVRARQLLVDLAREGACERLVARNGAVIFRFPELEGDKLDLLELGAERFEV